jgi:deazaflavin-dependent oxidoreductase (nitroreductase family)
MPLPRTIARLNRAGLNRLTRHVAPYLPGFGVVEHRGRRSGAQYRTPVNVFRVPGGFLIALTYGAGAEWVRNVLAAGGAVLHTRGRRVTVDGPTLEHDERRRAVPVVVRQILGILHVNDFLRLNAVPAVPAVPAP